MCVRAAPLKKKSLQSSCVVCRWLGFTHAHCQDCSRLLPLPSQPYTSSRQGVGNKDQINTFDVYFLRESFT